MSEREYSKPNYFPFNSYDVFGYIIPGLSFIVACFLFDQWVTEYLYFNHAPIHSIISNFYKSNQDGFNFDSIVFFLVALLMIYVIGHVVATISSFYIDRLLIRKGYQYPLHSLLKGFTKEDELPRRNKTIRSNFIISVMSILLIFGLGVLNLYSHLAVKQPEGIIYHIVFLVLMILFVSSLVASFSTVWVTIFKWSSPRNFFSSIYSRFSKGIADVVGSSEQLDELVLSEYKDFLKNRLNINPLSTTSDIYWLSYMYLMRTSHSSISMAVNWLHLYSFARNLSTAFFLAFCYTTFSISINSHEYAQSFQSIGTFNFFIAISIPALFCFLGFLFLVRFYYLYYSYYTKFIIRACAFLHTQKKKEQKSKKSKVKS
jgi:hypothetical protein